MKNNVDVSISQKTKELTKQKQFWIRWAVVVGVLAVLVTIGVNLMLRYKGQALNHTKMVLECAYEVHQHTDDCYEFNEDGELELLCGYVDYVVHTHNELCCDAEGELVCDLPEIPGHAHDSGCYEEQKILICGLEETEGASASAEGMIEQPAETGEVQTNPTENSESGQSIEAQEADVINPESIGNADSAEDTAETEILQNTENIVGDGDTENTEAITCQESEGAETGQDANPVEVSEDNQISGHVHTEECYETIMVLICDRVPMHEHTESCYETDENGEKVLVCGELQLVAHIHTEECMEEVELTEEEILALNLEETESEETEETEETEEFVREYQDDKYYVKVSYTKEANIPKEAELVVTEITTENEQYQMIENDTLDLLNQEEQQIYVSLDIGFYVDGVEIEPEAEVSVTVQFLNQEFDADEEMTIIHTEDTGSSIIDTQTLDEEGQLNFTTDSFSIYSFVVTTKPITNLSDGIYGGKISYSHNQMENSFLTGEFEKYRNDNGALGRVASSFHLVAFNDLKVNVDLNGNILAKNAYIQPNDWGTRGDYGIWELSYVQNLLGGTIGSQPERGVKNDKNGQPVEHILVVGSSIETSSDTNHSYLSVGGSGITIGGSCAQTVIQDIDSSVAPFINLSQVETEIKEINKSLRDTQDQNVYKNFSDINNRYLLLTDPDVAGYITINASELNSCTTPIRLYGFQNGSDGNAKKGSIIINVDCSGISTLTFPSEAKVHFGTEYYFDGNGKCVITNQGTPVSTNETVDFSGGKVIWNLINCSTALQITNVQNMTGAIIAPEASVTASNMNGTIVAQNITITGETHRTDFTGTTIPFSAEIYATKLVDGYSPTEADDTFSFTLEEWKYNSWQLLETRQNAGKDVTFSNIVYSKDEDIGTHWYKMSEVQGDNLNYQYDSTVYIIRVDVEKAANAYSASYSRYKIQNGETVTISNNTISCSNQSTSSVSFVNLIQFENCKMTEISVEKEWVDIDGVTAWTEHLPDSVEVTLYQTTNQNEQGTQYGNSVMLKPDSEGRWFYTWTNLPRADSSGNPFYYYVTETPNAGYELISSTLYLQEGTIYLKNQKIAETISLKVNKEFFLEVVHSDAFDINNYSKVEQPLLPNEDAAQAYVKFRVYYSKNGGANWNTSKFPVTVIEADGNSYTTDNTGTFTIRADKGWSLTLEGLPKYGVEDGKIFEYTYQVKESESNLEAFPYYFDYSTNTTTKGYDPGIWSWPRDYGYEFTIFNECREKTEIQIKKEWLTYSGDEDSIQSGSIPDATIGIQLWKSDENKSGSVPIANYYWTATNIWEVDSSGEVMANPSYQAYSLSDTYWNAKIAELPKYYVRQDGTLAEYVYFVSEKVNDNGYTYGKYVLNLSDSDKVNGIWVYRLVNRSTESYELPKTGGRGTLLYRIERFFEKIFS